MAIKNISESAFSVKNMRELLSSDNWALDRAVLFCNYDNKCIVQDEFLLDKYYNYFEQFLTEIELDEKYFYNPQLFAYDYYGDSGLDFIVLYFSGCTTIYEFNKKKIQVFEYSHLKELNQLFTFYKTNVDNSKRNPILMDAKSVMETDQSAKYMK